MRIKKTVSDDFRPSGISLKHPSWVGNFIVEYLHIFKPEFKKAVARESGAQEGLFDEKPKGRQSWGSVPLK
jgi:hypothetical protein